MTSSIFGRGESTGAVNKVELFLLHAMAQGTPINTGAWLLRQILFVAKQTTGKICIGGLLTVIAEAFGFEPVEGVHHAVEGSDRIDLDTLQNMRMCRHIGDGTYRLLDVEGHVIQPEHDDPYDVPEEAQFQEQGAHADSTDFPEHAAEASSYPAQSSSDFHMSQLMTRLERIDTRFDQINASMAHQDEMHQQRFDQIDARLAQQEETHQQMMAILRRMEDRLP